MYPVPIMYFPGGGLIEYVGSTSDYVASGSVILTTPSGIQAGDLMIAWTQNASNAAGGLTSPSGWTRAGTDAPTGASHVSGTGGSIQKLACDFRIATGTEDPTYTWTWATAANETIVTMAIFRGFSTVEAWRFLGVSHTLSTITSVAYTALADGLGVYCFIIGPYSVVTPPSGLTLLDSYAAEDKRAFIYWRNPEAAGVVPQETMDWSSTGQSPCVFYQHLLV